MSIQAQWLAGPRDVPLAICLNRREETLSLEALEDWLASHREAFRTILTGSGAILFRGFSTSAHDDRFELFLEHFGTAAEDYIGGSTPRTRLTERSYTATELSGKYSIALHQEMSYLPRIPEAIAFHCKKKARTGGRSLLADARLVTRAIPRNVREFFASRGIAIKRALPSHGSIFLASGISRPWQDVFETDDPARVFSIAKARGWNVRWEEDATLSLTHASTPALRNHPLTGEELWCNQAHYYSADCMVRWADADERISQKRYLQRLLQRDQSVHLNEVTTAAGEPIEPTMLLQIWDVLRDHARPVDMEAGDILLIDNYRVMHGREQFTGERIVHAGLIERVR